MDKWWIPALGHPQMDLTMFLFLFLFSLTVFIPQ